ncbi:MAG: MFS transporter [Rhodospirillales bacterium]|nr:MFS transporter [Rhodospirillales bacterium]
MAQETVESLNIPGRLERLPISRFTWLIVSLAGAAWFIESLDIGAIGVVLESIRRVMDLTPGQVGMLAVSSTAGIVVGLIPAGYLADSYGRKRILVWGVVEYSALTMLAAFSPNYGVLLILRFLSGLGMGAVFPLPYAIVSEFVPRFTRTKFNGVLDGCLSVGYFLAPLIGAAIIPHFAPTLSWRVYLLVCGLPLLYAAIAHKWLPESPRWMEVRLGREKAETAMRAIESGVERETGAALPPPRVHSVNMQELKKRPSAAEVWASGQLSKTVIGSTAMVSALLMFYVVMIYMPTLLVKEGYTIAHSLLYTAIITGSAIPGKLLNGWLSDVWGRKPTYILFMVLASIGALMFGTVHSLGLVITYGCLMGFFGTGTFPGLKMYYAEQFPTRLRATGSSTVETIGRFLGGVVGPYLVPVIILTIGLSGIFRLIAIIGVIGPLVVLLWGKETAGQTLEEASGLHLASD